MWRGALRDSIAFTARADGPHVSCPTCGGAADIDVPSAHQKWNCVGLSAASNRFLSVRLARPRESHALAFLLRPIVFFLSNWLGTGNLTRWPFCCAQWFLFHCVQLARPCEPHARDAARPQGVPWCARHQHLLHRRHRNSSKTNKERGCAVSRCRLLAPQRTRSPALSGPAACNAMRGGGGAGLGDAALANAWPTLALS